MHIKLLFTVILILIFFLGAYLRFANLEGNPNGLYVDEASTGVNAWSILKTGRDEYGKSFPLSFRFLGSYTPPLYTYLTSIVIFFNGFSITSVRLVSVVSGVFLIIIFYFIVRSLNILKTKRAVLAGAALFAISPWAIFYSRIGYEINLAFLLYSLGILFLVLSFNNPKNLIPGFIFLSLSTNAYHSERLLSHITVVCFLILFRKTFLNKSNIKILIFGFLMYLFILIPQVLTFFTPANITRGFGLFYSGEIVRQIHKLSFLPVFLSAPIAFLREFTSQYLAYFSPRNLFFQSDPDLQRSLPEISVFYSWESIFYVIGLFVLIKLIRLRASKFIIMLFLLAPVPSALTGDPFSTQRALPLLIPVMIIITLGLDKFFQWRMKFAILVVFIFITISLLYLYRSLAVLLPNERAKIWGYGFQELAKEITKYPDKKFLIDNGRIKPAYIELAFYLKIPPKNLQDAVDQSVKKKYYLNTSWNDHYIMNGFETRTINWEEDIYKNQILVGDELAISQQQANEHFLRQVFEIKSPKGEIIFKGFETNPNLKCASQFIHGKCNNFVNTDTNF
ncbi:hypothetical protein A3F00_04735 [Candidatus Daviesbacteria bacterium RIFCSPHIGHO2_12_FULL_37_11]|uniref:Uncharacterized protein n=1 Tax=Candidatus Daviesbacteria bacterium RIFCSPHIGHO2_12_FULL_37_11 TaxID=1797777 RepID=A0A1F5KBC8_9BACT|nr:MAG: hypothetical protein A3F00_04735 [Candidatus Daviesbacteria bacterium RIFCSPHIGHO2_12_FULL_37_11]